MPRKDARFFAGRLAIVTTAIFAIGSANLNAAVELISTNTFNTPSASGNGESVAPTISADGRFVLFTSAANDLVAGDNHMLGLDVFLQDRLSNTTVLVSTRLDGVGGGNGASIHGNISTNGRYVVFQSDASDLVPADTNGATDIFVRDLVSGTNRLVSMATNGIVGNGPSFNPVMTPDGRFVAFISAASNLVTGDLNVSPDVFVRDLMTDTTMLVSVGAVRRPSVQAVVISAPAMTPDGRFVAFSSNASNLVAGVTNILSEVYVRDLIAAQTFWPSSNCLAIAKATFNFSTNVPSYHPSISDDGRFVAFKTGPTNSVSPNLVFRYDSTSGTNVLIHTNAFPAPNFGEDVYGPEMTFDGRFVVFVARQASGSVLYSSVELWDEQAGSNVLVSADLSGLYPANTTSHTPAVTPDGNFVTFLSDAATLVGNSVSNGFHIYRRDILVGTNLLVDTDTNGIGSVDGVGAEPGMSADGTLIVFSEPDGALVASDRNGFWDAFLRDAVNGSTELISKRDPGVNSRTGNAPSASWVSLSADGRWVVFASFASDLVPNDTNNHRDVFLHDRLTGSNILVSAAPDGGPALKGSSGSPVISGNGRYVVYVSSATNIAGITPPFASQVFRYDVQTGSNVLVTISSTGLTVGNGESSEPSVSQDGRYIVFQSRASNLVPGTPAATLLPYRRDMVAGTTVALSTTATFLPPTLSANGRFVAFDTVSPARIFVWDSTVPGTIYTNNVTAVALSLSPTGRQLFWETTSFIQVADVIANTNYFSINRSVSFDRLHRPAVWSGDGRYAAFATGTSLVGAGDGNLTNDVYLCDLETGVRTLVSANFNHASGGNAGSDAPSMSWDGRFIAFRSSATNLIIGDTNVQNLFLFDRFTGSNSFLTLKSSSPSWTLWTGKPVIDASGRVAAFPSWAPTFTAGDLNRVQDIFVVASSMTDIDHDGLDDAWENNYFGSLARDGSLDYDGDGAGDLAEFLAATDPTNPASALRLEITLAGSPSNSVLLNWSAQLGKNYRVQYKEDLANTDWVDTPGSLWIDGNRAYFTAPSTIPTNRFYRIFLQP